MESERAAWCWAWVGIGSLAAVGFALAAGAASPPAFAAAGGIALWAADRDACMLYGLDSDLVLARRVPLGWPLDVERTRDGGAFVLRSGNAGPGFGQRVVKLDAQGSVTNETWVEPCLDLDTIEGRQALLVEGPSSSNPLRRALRLEPEGALHVIAEGPHLRCLCSSRASVLIGTDDGRIERHPVQGGGMLAWAAFGGTIGDLAVGADPGGVFALDIAGGGRLLCLAPDLSLRWEVALGMSARHLGVVPGEERVWLADTAAARVRRYGPGGTLELEQRGLPLAGLDRSLAWHDGGVLLCASGALLHLDPQGHLAPGQGGFNTLVDLAR